MVLTAFTLSTPFNFVKNTDYALKKHFPCLDGEVNIIQRYVTDEATVDFSLDEIEVCLITMKGKGVPGWDDWTLEIITKIFDAAEPWYYNVGVPQGSRLGPVLWLLVANKVLNMTDIKQETFIQDNRTFLIPWLVCVSMATLLDVFLCVYLTAKDSSDPLHSLLFITDFFFSALNVYCLLCVISQYQEYSAGRGRPEDCIRMEAQPDIHCLRFHWPSFQVLNQPPADQEGVQEDASGGNFLTVPGPTPNPINKCHQSTESVNSCSSTRYIVEICRNESCSG
ncbi:hypothetical protein AVEN_256950-1 [Araneus ventricosus]|uniref:Reverse transcriptase domain-containing protein n=1 Tax=Araneus ventricosus TaxID=182803 RepID=A0A4Y2ED02_ARAVE|nr:hypothetical protein AVEN_256950-1 [Araneus ventricosus]